MLVLSRKEGEAITLGDDIELQVIRCQGNRVQLGIKAPKSIDIRRSELLHSLQIKSVSDAPTCQVPIANAS